MLNDLSTLTNEVWSMIAEFPDYQVSNHGRVKHIYRNGREYILRPWLDRYGYPTVHIHRTTQRVHRLVAQAFIPNLWNLPEVHHRNRNRADNRVENLRWCSRRKHMRKHHIGIPIVCLDKDTYELLNTYDSAAEAERKKGIPQRSIRSCCTRDNNHTRCNARLRFCRILHVEKGKNRESTQNSVYKVFATFIHIMILF